MAKGTASKEIVMEEIKKIFPSAFLVDGKELRIPMMEAGEEVQIKVALTCAKTNVEHNSGVTTSSKEVNYEEITPTSIEMTEEEKERVAKLVASLNL